MILTDLFNAIKNLWEKISFHKHFNIISEQLFDTPSTDFEQPIPEFYVWLNKIQESCTRVPTSAIAVNPV